MVKKPKKEWWQDVFDERYTATYINALKPEVIKNQVDFITNKLPARKGMRVLDLACGTGRHALELAHRGFEVTGVDYSKKLLEIAKRQSKEAGINVQFSRKDMRQLAYQAEFDLVISMFTSFGYFQNESDHFLVVKGVSDALKSGGYFLLDLNNAINFIITLAAKGAIEVEKGRLHAMRSEILANGLKITTVHNFDPLSMRWKMQRAWQQNGEEKEYQTDVRLFTFPEIRWMLESAGLKITSVYGGFDGKTCKTDSERLIIVARKK